MICFACRHWVKASEQYRVNGTIYHEACAGIIKEHENESITFANSGSGLYPSLSDNLKTIKELINLDYIDRKDYGALTVFDSILLQNIIDVYEVNKVLEIGRGSTTLVMENQGVEVLSIALDYPNLPTLSGLGKSLNGKGSTFIDVDLYRISRVATDADLIVIDGYHGLNFAKHYCEAILKYNPDTPVWLHDWYGPDRPTVYGEQHYLMNSEFAKAYECKLYTDVQVGGYFGGLALFDGESRIRPSYPWPPMGNYLSNCAAYFEPR